MPKAWEASAPPLNYARITNIQHMTHKRIIKSFVKRTRPLSINKQKIFSELWPNYGLTTTPPPVFLENTPLTLEIGFGNGETIFSLAKNFSEQKFIGIEVYKPGIISLLTFLAKEPLNNIKIYNEDAITVLEKHIPAQTLDKVFILFPDPWPKKKHHKRRLIQPKFIELLAKKMKARGILHVATDWENYADHITQVLKNSTTFSQIPPQNNSPLQQNRSITTKFEKRGEKEGRQIFDLSFITK